MFALNQRMQILLPVVRMFFIALICWFFAKAIIAGQSTLGALLWSLMPAVIIGITFVAFEFLKREGISLSMFFKIEKASFKTWFFLFVVSVVIGVVLMFLSIRSPVDLIMILIIVTALVVSILYMIQNAGVNAICVFILVWPFMIFERSSGHVTFKWTQIFNKLDLGLQTTDIMIYFYIILLISAWVIRKVIRKEPFVSESWSLGIWFFLFSGFFSLIIIPELQIERLSSFISVILLPVLLFILFVNEIKSWKDVRKIFTMSILSITMLAIIYIYFTFFRYTDVELTSIESMASGRGGSGTLLGSQYAGYRGFLLEHIIPLLLPFIIFLIIATIRRSIKVGYILIIILLLTVQFYTFGRAAWFASALSFLPFLWGSSRGRWISLASLLSVSIFVVYSPQLSELISIVFQRFSLLSSLESIRLEHRYRISVAAIEMFLDHPWTGVGLKLFGNVSSEYGLSYSYSSVFLDKIVQGSWSHAHSTFFHMIAEQGIWGLIAFGTLLWIPIRSLIRQNLSTISDENTFQRAWQGVTLVMISYFFIINGIGYWWIEEPFTVLLILTLAVCRIGDRLDASKTNEDKIYTVNLGKQD